MPAPEAALAGFHTDEYLAVLRAVERRRAGAGRVSVRPRPRRQPDLARLLRGLRPGLRRVDPRRRAGGAGRGRARVRLRGRAPPRHAGSRVGVLLPERRRARDPGAAAHGLRVAYVDIDAHHGDGVQAAFYRSADVLTVSTHERGDRLFPGTGGVEEIGEGPGRGYAVNLPLNPYTDDAVYLDAFDAVVPSVLRAFRPDVVVAQLGIDGHRTDPLTHLALSSTASPRPCAASSGWRPGWWRWAAAGTTSPTWRGRGPRRGR